MPAYEIDLPTGTYEVESDRDLTDQEVYEAVLAQLDRNAWEAQQEVEKVKNRKSHLEMMTGEEKAWAGLGEGLSRVGRNVTNLLLPESLEPEWATDEAIRKFENDSARKELLADPYGAGGSIAGEIVGTLPVGMGAGAVARGVGAGVQGLSRLGQGAGAANRLRRATARTGRVLGSSPVSGAVEGAAAGAAAAPIDQRAEGAAIGGALGGGIGVATNALGRAIRSKGVVKMKPEAEAIMQQGKFVPIGLGADEGLIRTMYRDWLPAMPGGRAYLRQSDEVFNQWRREMAEEGLPKWAKNKVDDIIDPENPQTTMDNLQQFWENEAYEKINKKVFNTSAQWMGKKAQKILSDIDPNVRQWFYTKLMRVMDSNGRVTGKDLMNIRKEISDYGRMLEKSNGDRAMEVYRLSEVVESMIDKQLSIGRKDSVGRQIYKEWVENKEAYPKFLDLERATYRARGDLGKFTPKQLADQSAVRARRRRGASGRGALQGTAQQAQQGLGKEVSRPGFWRSAATYGLAAGLTGANLLSAPATAATLVSIMAANRMLSSKMAQRILMGDVAARKAAEKILQNHPDAARIIRQAITAAGATGVTDATGQ
jgi:hypothetical protein